MTADLRAEITALSNAPDESIERTVRLRQLHRQTENGVTTVKIDLLIDGRDVATDSYFEVRDPGRIGDVVGLLAEGTAVHVDQAVEAAHRAFWSWKRTSPGERAALLTRAADLLVKEGTVSLR